MTTHFAVADRDGNVVSVTQTLGGGFGSGAAVGGTGIFLNNMASYFELEESSPNRIGRASASISSSPPPRRSATGSSS